MRKGPVWTSVLRKGIDSLSLSLALLLLVLLVLLLQACGRWKRDDGRPEERLGGPGSHKSEYSFSYPLIRPMCTRTHTTSQLINAVIGGASAVCVVRPYRTAHPAIDFCAIYNITTNRVEKNYYYYYCITALICNNCALNTRMNVRDFHFSFKLRTLKSRIIQNCVLADIKYCVRHKTNGVRSIIFHARNVMIQLFNTSARDPVYFPCSPCPPEKTISAGQKTVMFDAVFFRRTNPPIRFLRRDDHNSALQRFILFLILFSAAI